MRGLGIIANSNSIIITMNTFVTTMSTTTTTIIIIIITTDGELIVEHIVGETYA